MATTLTGTQVESCESLSSGVWTAPPTLQVLSDPEQRISDSRCYSTAQVAGFIDTQMAGLRQFVAEQFLLRQRVLAVAFQFEEDVLHVWTILDEWDAAEAEAIYSLELSLMDRFGGALFDFYVIPAEGRSISALVDEQSAFVIKRDSAHR